MSQLICQPNWGNNLNANTVNPVSVTAKNANGLLLSAGGDIHRFQNTNGFAEWPHVSIPYTSPCVYLSAGYDDSMLVVLDSGESYALTQHGWQDVSFNAVCGAIGDNYSHVYSENDYTVEIVSSGNKLTTFTPVKMTQLTTTMGNSYVYGLGENGYVYYYNANSNSWHMHGDKQMKQIHASLASYNSLQLVGVDTNGQGYAYNGATWETITNTPAGGQLVSLEAGNGYIWATAATGEVFRGYF